MAGLEDELQALAAQLKFGFGLSVRIREEGHQNPTFAPFGDLGLIWREPLQLPFKRLDDTVLRQKILAPLFLHTVVVLKADARHGRTVTMATRVFAADVTIYNPVAEALFPEA